MAIDDTSMPQWYVDGMAEMERREAAATVPTELSAPQAPAASPFENMSAQQLDALGVSPAWAGMDAEQLASMERQQRRRDIAGRLGVSAEFLPEGIEDADDI